MNHSCPSMEVSKILFCTVLCWTMCVFIQTVHCVILNITLHASEGLPFTFSAAILETVPYLLLAVQVNVPESSGKTSAITKVHISSGVYTKEKHTHILKAAHLVVSTEG